MAMAVHSVAVAVFETVQSHCRTTEPATDAMSTAVDFGEECDYRCSR